MRVFLKCGIGARSDAQILHDTVAGG